MTVADLQDFDGEPRVQDLRIGERARLSRARDVRQVIKNNEAEFLRYGPLRVRTANDTGGRPATEYWLNEGQTLGDDEKATLSQIEGGNPESAGVRPGREKLPGRSAFLLFSDTGWRFSETPAPGERSRVDDAR